MEETLINGKPLSYYLRHPGALKVVGRNELNRLIELYPYSAHLHLLLTVKDHLENNTTNRDLLERAALYISDRRKLGEWMNKLQSLQQDEALTYGKEHLEAMSQSLETLVKKHDEPGSVEVDDLRHVGDDLEENQHTGPLNYADLSEEEIWVEQVSITEENLAGELTVTIAPQEKSVPKEGTIVENTEESGQEALIEPEIQEIQGEKAQTTDEEESEISEKLSDLSSETETKIPVEDQTFDQPEEEDEEEDDDEEEEEEEEEEEKEGEVVDVHSEHELGAAKEAHMRDDGEQSEKEEISHDEISQEPVDSESLSEERVSPEAETTAVIKSSGQEHEPVLENPLEESYETPFLRWLHRLETAEGLGYEDLEAKRRRKLEAESEILKTDRLKKKKKKKKKKKSWKMESLRPDETLVSEALADLLASQGHLDRAIEMYEKLRLTIPEKSVFFAQKIKALDQKK